MIRFKLAERIEDKQFRDGERLTLMKVAEDSGVNRMTLSKIRNERGCSTTTEVVDRLCKYFECKVQDLLEYVPEIGSPGDVKEGE